MVATEGFWAYRAEQEALGRANGMQPFSKKAFYAAVREVDFVVNFPVWLFCSVRKSTIMQSHEKCLVLFLLFW